MSHRLSFRLMLVVGTALLSACGSGGEQDEKTVAMRDMEVVDGTATDAMTNLDGVQSEGMALPPAPGATRAPAAATQNETATAADSANDDVVSDQ